MRIKKMQRKGEITTQQIVTVIILITSFVVILFLLFRLNLGETSDKEICHNSVVLSARGGFNQNLDCKTNYLCISGGEDCERISATTTQKVNPDSKEEIMKVIADEMVDCWWMFGEGEFDYLTPDVRGYHCAICTILEFDEEIQDSHKEISYFEFYEYLRNTNKEDSISYLEYLYGVFELESLSELNDRIDFDSEKIDLAERYVIVTGMNPNLIRKDKFVHSWIVKSNEITSKTKCDVFDITKA